MERFFERLIYGFKHLDARDIMFAICLFGILWGLFKICKGAYYYYKKDSNPNVNPIDDITYRDSGYSEKEYNSYVGYDEYLKEQKFRKQQIEAIQQMKKGREADGAIHEPKKD